MIVSTLLTVCGSKMFMAFLRATSCYNLESTVQFHIADRRESHKSFATHSPFPPPNKLVEPEICFEPVWSLPEETFFFFYIPFSFIPFLILFSVLFYSSSYCYFFFCLYIYTGLYIKGIVRVFLCAVVGGGMSYLVGVIPAVNHCHLTAGLEKQSIVLLKPARHILAT